MKTTHWTISTLLILTNLYFIPYSFTLLKPIGGHMGYGLHVLPISISVNLLLLPAGLAFARRFKSNSGLLVINSVGLVWALFWLIFLVAAPIIDW